MLTYLMESHTSNAQNKETLRRDRAKQHVQKIGSEQGPGNTS